MSIKDYIQGNRRGKDANWLEREAMNDPFLQDALDGIEAVSGNHVPIIERLENKFSRPSDVPQRNKMLFLYLSIAASILLLIGLYVFWEKTDNTKQTIAMLQPDENENKKVVEVEPSITQPVQKEKLQQEVLVIAKTTPKVKQTPTSPSKNFEKDESLEVPAAIVADVEAIVSDSFTERSVKITAEKTPQMIRGKVVDEAGKPLDFVSVLVKEFPSAGTYTDDAGNYTITVPAEGQTLAIGFIGYIPQEVAIGTRSTINIALESDAVQFSETVVTAMGIKRTEKSLSYAVSAVSKNDTDARVSERETALNKVVVVEYDTKRKSSIIGSAAAVSKNDADSRAFGEKEFRKWCQEKADKNICEGKDATVKLSFFIDETGKPTEIEYKSYSCEDAKDEIENLLISSPAWTKTNRKISMTIKWQEQQFDKAKSHKPTKL